jgi:hypothetical protein
VAWAGREVAPSLFNALRKVPTMASKRYETQVHDDPTPPDQPLRVFPTGAKPTPPDVLQELPTYCPLHEAPPDFAIVPQKLDFWGNDRFGVCVTSEEAFNKACWSPEIFITAENVIAWAKAHGVLNGATLTEVMDAFKDDGFRVPGQLYNDGPYATVRYADLPTLKNAIAVGTEGRGSVKIGIMSSALPALAGNQQGWYAFGPGKRGPQDHCVGLCGSGTAGFLFDALGIPLPKGVDRNKADCLLLFTWSTLGIVDHAWLKAACSEAFLRTPSTVGDPPLGPPPPPPPPPPPAGNTLVLKTALPAGTYTIGEGEPHTGVSFCGLLDTLEAIACATNPGGFACKFLAFLKSVSCPDTAGKRE